MTNKELQEKKVILLKLSSVANDYISNITKEIKRVQNYVSENAKRIKLAQEKEENYIFDLVDKYHTYNNVENIWIAKARAKNQANESEKEKLEELKAEVDEANKLKAEEEEALTRVEKSYFNKLHCVIVFFNVAFTRYIIFNSESKREETQLINALKEINNNFSFYCYYPYRESESYYKLRYFNSNIDIDLFNGNSCSLESELSLFHYGDDYKNYTLLKERLVESSCLVKWQLGAKEELAKIPQHKKYVNYYLKVIKLEKLYNIKKQKLEEELKNKIDQLSI